MTLPSSSFFSGTNPTPTEYENAVDLVAQATTQATAALASQTAAATSAQSAQGYSVSAGTSAETATQQAAAASTSATAAAASQTAAAASATSASSSATSASTSASNSATSATNAANSATSASGSATSASTYATNAANSATAAANSASDAAATLANALTKSDNLASLSNKSTARSNLGVAIGSDVQAWDADLDAIAAISSTSGLLKKTAANTWSLDTTSYHSGTLGLSQGGTGATDATGARTALGLGTAATAAATSFAQVANNLSDLVSASTARSNLGLGSVATLASTAVLQSANNLSDLGNVTTARTNLGLSALATTTPGTGVATALGVNTGTAGAFVVNGGALGTPASGTLTNCSGLPAAGVTGLATVATTGAYSDLSGKPTLGGAASLNVGTTTGTVAAGDDSRITGSAQKSSNLSDLASASTARTNLGLTDLATTTPGTGVATALGVAVGTDGAFVVKGGALGTPSGGTLTNATGLPIVAGTTGTLTAARGGTGLTALGTGVATALGNNTNAASGLVALDANQNASIAGTLTMGSSFLRNRLINGSFDIWQRGTTVGFVQTNATMRADRWGGVYFQEGRHQRVSVTSPPTGLTSVYACRVGSSTTTEAAGGTRMCCAQVIENMNCYDLVGKWVILSFWVKFSAATISSSTGVAYGNFNGMIIRSTAAADAAVWSTPSEPVNQIQIANGSLPTTWTKYTIAGFVPSNATNVGVRFSFDNTGNTASADTAWYDVTQVQLEEGQVATPFERRQYGQELMLCQRYYTTQSGLRATIYADSAISDGQLPVYFKVSMRTTPTVTISMGGTTLANTGTATVGSTTSEGFQINIDSSSGAGMRGYTSGSHTASAEL